MRRGAVLVERAKTAADPRAAVALLGVLAAFGGVALLSASGASRTASAATADGPGPWSCRDRICQRVSTQGDQRIIELKSERPRTAWVEVELVDLQNVKSLRPTPDLVRLGAGETRTAGVLEIEDPRQTHRYQMRWLALAGDPQAVHDERWHYRMPFGGTRPVTISQAYDGPFTHKGLGAYAVDFPMPDGTPILAARGGTVVEVVDDPRPRRSRASEDASESDDHVVIEHADGTFARYGHLQPKSVPVHVGRRVESGDRLGLSGETGLATGPHLHFEVYKIRRDGHRETIPVHFWDGTATGFLPRTGSTQPPACERGADARCRPGELATETRSPSSATAPASEIAR